MRLKKAFRLLLLRLQYAHFCIARLLQPYKAASHCSTPAFPSIEDSTFTALNENGKETPYRILFVFSSDEDTHYVVYVDASEQGDDTEAYASRYTTLGEDMQLLPIETQEEWKLIQDTLSDVQERLDRGVSLDRLEKVEDEILEPIHLSLWKRMSVWSQKLHFPINILPLYILGVVLMHSLSPISLPIWAEIGFILIELLVMHICYTQKKGMASVGHIAIGAWLYFHSLMFPWLQFCCNPEDMQQAAIVPWHMRGAIILIFVFSAIYNTLRQRHSEHA